MRYGLYCSGGRSLFWTPGCGYSAAVMTRLLSPSAPALLVSVLLAWLAGAAAAQAPDWLTAPLPALVSFEEPIQDLGDRYQFEVVEHRFPVFNQSQVPVRFLSVEPVSQVGSGRAEPQVLPPGGQGEIVVRQPLGNRLGEVTFRFKVETDHPEARERKLALRAFVQSAFDPETAWIDFGEIERGSGAMREVELASREVARFRVTGFEDAPSWLVAEPLGEAGVAEEGLRVRLKVLPGATLGAQVGKIRLKTDVPQQPWFEVSYRLQIFGDIVPEEATFDLGLARIGQVSERQTALRSRSGRSFEIEKIEGAVAGLAVDDLPCTAGEEPVPACRTLRLRLSPEEPGNLTGTLLVHLKGEPEPLPLPYGALAVAQDTPVKELPLPTPESGPLPFVPVSKLPPPPPPAAPAARREVTLRWRANQEENVYGYLVYRATQRSGPFRRLNAEIVRAGGAGRYEYVDRTVEPGVTYYYYLDSVSRSGAKQRFSNVLLREVAADATP